MERKEISLYTDGAASGNPGPGGYGAILICGDMKKELSGGYALTTNNRMELLAVIVGLEAIKWENARVNVFSDSSYVVRSVNEGWIGRWRSNGFKKVKNPDLWKRFLCVSARHQVKFNWVKGHADNPYNNRCDALAVQARSLPSLQDDSGYLATQSPTLPI